MNTELRKADDGLPERVVWINPKNKGVKGYKLTDQNGDLDSPVRSCVGCQHFGVHDFHYVYCSAQYADNQRPDTDYVYPWRGAGTHIDDATNCPIGERDGNTV